MLTTFARLHPKNEYSSKFNHFRLKNILPVFPRHVHQPAFKASNYFSRCFYRFEIWAYHRPVDVPCMLVVIKLFSDRSFTHAWLNDLKFSIKSSPRLTWTQTLRTQHTLCNWIKCFRYFHRFSIKSLHTLPLNGDYWIILWQIPISVQFSILAVSMYRSAHGVQHNSHENRSQ